jgi:tetratricopeptide (TPR) repeat protein
VELRRQAYARAVQLLEAALAQAPQATRIHYSLAMAYRGLGNAEAAKKHLALRGDRKPGAHDPLMVTVSDKGSSAYTHVQRGLLAAREGDYETAHGEFVTAVAQDPENEDAQMALYDSLKKLGKSGDARGQLDTILERFPANPIAHYQKAQLLDQEGETELAVVHYRAAVTNDPGYVRARYFLANKLMEKGSFAEAAEHYAVLRAAHPDEVRILYQLGLARLASGDCGRALEPLEIAHAGNPRQYLIIVALVRAASTCPAAGSSQREQTLTLARELHTNQPSPGSAETLAMALAANGVFDEAIALQTRLVNAGSTPQLEADLRRYQGGEPAQSAWPPDAPVYRSPPPTAGDD